MKNYKSITLKTEYLVYAGIIIMGLYIVNLNYAIKKDNVIIKAEKGKSEISDSIIAQGNSLYLSSKILEERVGTDLNPYDVKLDNSKFGLYREDSPISELKDIINSKGKWVLNFKSYNKKEKARLYAIYGPISDKECNKINLKLGIYEKGNIPNIRNESKVNYKIGCYQMKDNNNYFIRSMPIN